MLPVSRLRNKLRIKQAMSEEPDITNVDRAMSRFTGRGLDSVAFGTLIHSRLHIMAFIGFHISLFLSFCFRHLHLQRQGLLTDSALDCSDDCVGSVGSHVRSSFEGRFFVTKERVAERSRGIVIPLVLVDRINLLDIFRFKRAIIRSAQFGKSDQKAHKTPMFSLARSALTVLGTTLYFFAIPQDSTT